MEGAIIGIIFVIGIIVIIRYGIPDMAQRNKEHEEEADRRSKEFAQIYADRVSSDNPLSQKEIDHFTGMDKINEKEETKKIIKGAVVGGIIGGDAGAVVGATIAKNKIDNSKK